MVGLSLGSQQPRGASVDDAPRGCVLRDLRAQYGANVVLDGVSAQVPERGLTLLMGPNGAGKTTLLRSILGQTRCTGDVLWNGRRVDPARREIHVVFEDPPFYPHLTGRVNLAVLAPTSGTGRPGYVAPEVLRKRVRTYSLGQRKRLALAGALGSDAGLVLLDEPTNGLDRETLLRLGADLRADASRRALLVTGHHLDFYDDLVDHVIVLVDGRVVEEPVGNRRRDGYLAELYDRHFPPGGR